jgi:uroporphyrinogen-III decarboxylase
MENYFMDMVMHPDELNQLHKVIGAVYEARIHTAGKTGADAIFIGEDLGTQNGLLFSPDFFRQFFKVEYTRLLSIAHDYGMKVLLHSCGMNWEILEDLIDVGIDCFQFDQPTLYDMDAMAELFRRRKVALWSPVDIQKVMPTGDKAFIEEQTQRMLDLFEGFLIMKNYPDLHGIGVEPEWDMWAYDKVLQSFESH